jgi:hypothetical protein
MIELRTQDEPPLPDIKEGMYPIEYPRYIFTRRWNLLGISRVSGIMGIAMGRDGVIALDKL